MTEWQDRSDMKNLEMKFPLGFEEERIPADNFAGQSPNFPSNTF